jgi:two-component system sensor histidine kinase MtrB
VHDAQRRIRRGLRRFVARAVHTWRSSLQIRIGAITMIVAGTVVVIVSLVLFSQIRDQLLRVKRQAAIDQAQNGVLYAQSQVAGIATGDAASVRTALDRTVTQLLNRGGAAGDFEVAMVYRTGSRETPAESSRFILDALPADLRADVDNGGQSYKYHPMPDRDRELQPSLLIGAPVVADAPGAEQIELYYVFPLVQEEESLFLIRSTVIISGVALTLFVVGIGVMVTRLVVDPVRRAAGTAQQLAEGQLEQRMTVRGEDDLARLA